MQLLTINSKDFENIKKFVNSHEIVRGVGGHESACSIASINLALTGTLTDAIPGCMSNVIGNWIISVQDAMPHEMRNSEKWRAMLPYAAGTGCDVEKESERLRILRDWVHAAMPIGYEVADAHGMGSEWRDVQLNLNTRALDFLKERARKLYRNLSEGPTRLEPEFFRRVDVQVTEAVQRMATSLEATFRNEFMRRDVYGAEIANAAYLLVHITKCAAGDDGRKEADKKGWERLDPPSVLEKLVK